MSASCSDGLNPGDTLTDELTREGSRLCDIWPEAVEVMLLQGHPLENDLCAVSYKVNASGRVIFDLTSEVFDPLLILLDDNGNLLSWNDDWEASTNSRIVFEDPGVYEVDPVFAFSEETFYYDTLQIGSQLISGIWPFQEYGLSPDYLLCVPDDTPCVAFEFTIDSTGYYQLDTYSEQDTVSLVLLGPRADSCIDYADDCLEVLAYDRGAPSRQRFGNSRIPRVLTAGDYLVLVYREIPASEDLVRVGLRFSECRNTLEELELGETLRYVTDWYGPLLTYRFRVESGHRYIIRRDRQNLNNPEWDPMDYCMENPDIPSIEVFLPDGSHLDL